MKDEALSLSETSPDPGRKLNLLREYVQAFVLRSLSESEAFSQLSFVGGTALRFLGAVEGTFELLKSQPHMGARTKLSHAALEDSRFVPIMGFENILAFYRAQTDRIDVIRVIHGHRDIPNLV